MEKHFLSLQFYFSLNSFNLYIPLGHLKPMSPIFPSSWPRDHLNPIYNVRLPVIGNFIQAFWLKKMYTVCFRFQITLFTSLKKVGIYNRCKNQNKKN